MRLDTSTDEQVHNVQYVTHILKEALHTGLLPHHAGYTRLPLLVHLFIAFRYEYNSDNLLDEVAAFILE